MSNEEIPLTPIERQVLSAARESLETSEKRTEAMLARVLQASALPTETVEGSLDPSNPAPTTARAPLAQGAATAKVTSLHALAAWVLLGAGLGALGGAWAAREEAPYRELSERTRLLPHVSVATAPTPHEPMRRLVPVAQMDENKENKNRSSTSGIATHEEPTNSKAPLSFYDELSHLRRAQAAMKRGQAQLALGLMQTLRDATPKGALLVEREMTESLALCALGRQAEARLVAQRLLQRKPSAVYLARLKKSCALSKKMTPPSDENITDRTPMSELNKGTDH